MTKLCGKQTVNFPNTESALNICGPYLQQNVTCKYWTLTKLMEVIYIFSRLQLQQLHFQEYIKSVHSQKTIFQPTVYFNRIELDNSLHRVHYNLLNCDNLVCTY
jgi:hypothetical protein